jgi:hypothetical protein
VSGSASLVGGYHLAMLVGAGLAFLAALASLVGERKPGADPTG